jgi:hypothetical protein
MTNGDLEKLWDETTYFLDIAGLSRKQLLFYMNGYPLKTVLGLKDNARERAENKLIRFHDAFRYYLQQGIFPWQANEHKDDLSGWLFGLIDSYKLD